MDRTHTIKENLNKIEALIEAINRLNENRHELTNDALIFQIESVTSLSEETSESLQTIRTLCTKHNL